MCIPEFQTQCSHKSDIMTNGMINVLTNHLPSNYRLLHWNLLFSIEWDGCSHYTFYDKVSY